jgi:hypothetical protein
MTSNELGALAPVTQLLAEILERLSARGILTAHRPFSEAARALDDELRAIDPFFERQDQAAAILALRAAAWPSAMQATTLNDRAALAHAAWELQHLLATDDAQHVADLLRHAETGVDAAEMRPIEALLPVASRAIAEFRRLVSPR